MASPALIPLACVEGAHKGFFRVYLAEMVPHTHSRTDITLA